MKIADALYQSRWYDCGQNTKKIVQIMMMRAQRPLTISVGPFYVMSTETALVVRTKYRIGNFAVLTEVRCRF